MEPRQIRLSSIVSRHPNQPRNAAPNQMPGVCEATKVSAVAAGPGLPGARDLAPLKVLAQVGHLLSGARHGPDLRPVPP